MDLRFIYFICKIHCKNLTTQPYKLDPTSTRVIFSNLPICYVQNRGLPVHLCTHTSLRQQVYWCENKDASTDAGPV